MKLTWGMRRRWNSCDTKCRVLEFCASAQQQLSTYQELCRIWTGNEDVWQNYWSIEPSSLPSAVHVNFLLACTSVYDIASCIHSFAPAPDQSLFPLFNSEIQLSLHFKKGLLVLMHSLQFGSMYTCYLRFKGTIFEGFKLFWTLAILIRVASNSLCKLAQEWGLLVFTFFFFLHQ